MADLPLPVPTIDDAPAWVAEHLGGLYAESPGPVPVSGAFTGGQAAADAALGLYDVSGYARTRSEVLPVGRRGASRLSPYIRHGLLPLPRVWAAVGDGPARDRTKFRDELLWQEYSRHLYARLGAATARPLRYAPAVAAGAPWEDPWPRDMACMDLVVGELEDDGWLVNQTRMWMSAHWTVRAGWDWRAGEDRFFTHLLDGSRAANRLGWQWTIGAGTGKAYGFSRWQTEKRAPGLCGRCALRDACPIEDWPDDATAPARLPEPSPLLRSDPDVERTAGPRTTAELGEPEAVWLTAESLGDEDPALAAHPDLPAVFVLDRELLRGWQLSGKRLVFLAQTLADLGARRPLEVWLGDPVSVLSGRPVAATFTPVPGWRRRAAAIRPAVVHPWPWLVRPHTGSIGSFSAWRKRASR
ncbi:deoxyribodipyrimidine photolyase [Conexibacter sp. W3-3-2]|uniref:FAD-binding domain-containing protein n=1 Tax=Conexibacter sp. W3-3-2 TaxID=2675227 RepID=UPI0012B8A273|nr:FAD-binding domain-containing protein [Conexibacter sp. W3-3-2]MTD44782.1 deoxyribodipyrimidine photolyase [Conexibacter sp. W3-3-2]